MSYTIYTTDRCIYCTKAKLLLQSNDIEYEEINILENEEAYNYIKYEKGFKTVPQVFLADEYIGGYDDLYKYLLEND